MESQIQSIVESGEEDTYEVRTQIYIEQMGYETRNRVRGVFNGGLSLGLFSGLLSSSFDENVMRYLGAHGVLNVSYIFLIINIFLSIVTDGNSRFYFLKFFLLVRTDMKMM
ncbi:unnamed protein product [Malus baccata var. baccata]